MFFYLNKIFSFKYLNQQNHILLVLFIVYTDLKKICFILFLFITNDHNYDDYNQSCVIKPM